MMFCLGATVGRRIGDPYLMRHLAAKSADLMLVNLPHSKTLIWHLMSTKYSNKRAFAPNYILIVCIDKYVNPALILEFFLVNTHFQSSSISIGHLSKLLTSRSIDRTHEGHVLFHARGICRRLPPRVVVIDRKRFRPSIRPKIIGRIFGRNKYSASAAENEKSLS
jgi:hypothetical protein